MDYPQEIVHSVIEYSQKNRLKRCQADCRFGSICDVLAALGKQAFPFFNTPFPSDFRISIAQCSAGIAKDVLMPLTTVFHASLYGTICLAGFILGRAEGNFIPYLTILVAMVGYMLTEHYKKMDGHCSRRQCSGARGLSRRSY